jgi:transcriptional regulator with XRE-family HTH domain
MTIQERLKAIRKSQDLTQGEFGEKISFTDAAISMLESGKLELTDKTIKLICLTFGVREEWLRNGNGKMWVEENDPLTREIMAIVSELLPRAKALVLEHVRNLVKEYDVLREVATGEDQKKTG